MNAYFLKMSSAGKLVFDGVENTSAPLQIALHSDYVFDDDVKLKLSIIDTKEIAPQDDPLHHLEWVLDFVDVLSNQTIESVRGRLFTGGGFDVIAEKHANNVSYAYKKLDLSQNSLFDVVSSYDKAQAQTILAQLKPFINSLNGYRTKEQVFDLPTTSTPADAVVDSEKLTRQLIDLHPDYIGLTNVDDLGLIDVVGAVVERTNCHAFVELGDINDIRQVAALANSLAINDHRFRLILNATVSRSRNSILSKKTYRPCVGDYLAKHLARNAMRDNNGIPPLNVPIGGYDFPVQFVDISTKEGVHFDAESENILANAGVIALKAERYGSNTRFVYADILTQKDSDSSALRLGNAAEISTFIAKTVIGIVKRHLLKGASHFHNKAYEDCTKFLDNCVAAKLIMPSEMLGGKYYALTIQANAQKPFEATDIKMSYRPEGAVRQAFLDETLVK